MTDLDYDAVISFLNKVISWRADYKPEWKQAHIDKWNSYLSLLLPQHAITVRAKYNVPSDMLPMSRDDLKKKSELNARWKESYDMWLFVVQHTGELFPDDMPPAKKQPSHSGYTSSLADQNYMHVDTKIDLETRIELLEKQMNTVHDTANTALDTAEKVDTILTEQMEDTDDIDIDENYKSNPIADTTWFTERNPDYAIPPEITPEDAREMADILIQYGFIEDWGRDYTEIIKSESYRQYQRVKLMGGYEPHQSAPEWFILIYNELKAYWTKQGKQHWQNMVTHIKHNTNGSHLLHRGKDINDVPYGTFRNIVQTIQTDKHGCITVECIPYEMERGQVLAWRREQIDKWRRGVHTEINWAPPFNYTTLKSNAEHNAFWTDARREEFRQTREQEAAKFAN